MKRTLATLLSLSAVVFAAKAEMCPCFSAKEFDDIIDAHGKIGCHFTTNPTDPEVTSMSVAYLYEHHEPVGVLQAGVTTELMDDKLVLGGLCGVGSKKDLKVKNKDVKDYANNEYDPSDFQACVDIMESKCKAICPELHEFGEDRSGCGKLPF